MFTKTLWISLLVSGAVSLLSHSAAAQTPKNEAGNATPVPPKPTAAPEGKPQPPARAAPRLDFDPVVLPVVNANPRQIADLLNEVLPDSLARAVSFPPSVVFVGPPATLERARKLLNELDRSESDAADGGGAAVLSIAHRRAEELSAQLMPVLMGRSDLRVATDTQRGRLIFRGDKAAVERASTLVRALDVPPQTARVEFAFMLARTHGDVGGVIPADLAEVAKDLGRFGKLEVLGRFSTMAVENEEFRLLGGLSAGAMRAEIRGMLKSAAPDGPARLRVEAEFEPTSKEAAKNNERFGFAGTVMAPRGDYVVLSISPGGQTFGDSGILLMQVKP